MSIARIAYALVAVVFSAVTLLEGQAPSEPKGATVWDGVYTTEQAERGRVVYDQRCARCHDRGAAPLLTGDAFLRAWFEDRLSVPFAKISSTMPEDNPGSLPATVVADVLTFLLEASDFPAGTHELRSDPEALDRVQVTGKDGPGGSVPNFSLVQVLGCLAQRADTAWVLTSGTNPVRSRNPAASSSDDRKAAASKALGKYSYRLLDFATVGQESLKGQKVEVKGFLIRQSSEDRVNVTAVSSLGQSCAP